jgi:alanine racemase
LEEPLRPSWVEVDLEAITHNVSEIRGAVAPAAVCAVVKADGYGHGDVPAAEAALEGGAEWLAVALVEEGVRLREAGIEAPILLLSEPDPDDVTEVVAWDLHPTVYRIPFARALAAAAPSPYPVHVKIDTGMHRVGADPDAALDLVRAVEADDQLELASLWTHFAVAEEDAEYTRRQVVRFGDFVATAGAEGATAPMLHAANTAAALAYPEARFDLVRVGLGIYGLRPDPRIAPGLDLRPAMRLVSRVSMVRRLGAGERPSYGRRRPLAADATVATIPVGYADGVARRLSSEGGAVLIRGHRYPFAGTVTMDQIVVDVGDDPVTVGDEVVLLGRQGSEEISAEEWAGLLGTINYEIVCDFGPRLPRRYSKAGPQ